MGIKKQGFTLFELLVAILLLAMVSVMLYSVLNVGIKFSAQGSRRVLAMEREYGLLNLLKSQISSAVYDYKTKKLLISSADDIFRLVTRNPYIYENAGIVLAIYRYNSSEQAIYYSEKRDYYNTDYPYDKYVPDFDEMTILSRNISSFAVTYDQDTGPEVDITYEGQNYSVVPKCADDKALSKLQENAE